MNKLNAEKQTQVIKALIEGNSIRSTVRMTGVAKGTVLKLLVSVGDACQKYQSDVMKNLPCNRLEVDEIWNFCYAKDKNVPKNLMGQPGIGSVWTFTAIRADTKLVPSWLIGKRDLEHATAFLKDLAGRLYKRVQLTTDGYKPYLKAVDIAFGGEVDYAVLTKIYGQGGYTGEGRYSPAECIDIKKEIIVGRPREQHVSTSYAERQNLTMRMRMRRFTRLTNGFSKKIDNLKASVSLHFMTYNFCRVHQTLRVTPAMEAGLTDHIWDITEVLELTKKYGNVQTRQKGSAA